jgi:hypothetical protein
MDERARTLAELGVVFGEVGAEHALVGGLAAGHHGRTRATIDVDMLVPGAKLRPLASAFERRGYVVMESLPDMIRVYPPGADPAKAEAIADLVSKDAHPVLRAAFTSVEPADVLGHRVNLVRRGAFVALKFHAISSPRRRHGDRLQDVVDIERVVARHFDADDLALARRIIEHDHPGAPDELEKLIDDLRSGRPVTV